MKPVSYVHSTNKQHSKCFCCVTGEDFLWTFSLFRSVSPRLHVEAEVRGQMNKKVLAWVLHNFFFSSGINSLGIYALATISGSSIFLWVSILVSSLSFFNRRTWHSHSESTVQCVHVHATFPRLFGWRSMWIYTRIWGSFLAAAEASPRGKVKITGFLKW